jgi:hypothetical protein
MTPDDFIKEYFTDKGLFIHKTDNRFSVKKLTDNSEVAYIKYMIQGKSIELVQIKRVNKNTNNTYKGIGKNLIVAFAIEAFKNNINTIHLSAVPDSKGNTAKRLFKYYANLGADPITNINETSHPDSWIQEFNINVLKVLEANNINLPGGGGGGGGPVNGKGGGGEEENDANFAYSNNEYNGEYLPEKGGGRRLKSTRKIKHQKKRGKTRVKN